jgi:hypothetical protein
MWKGMRETEGICMEASEMEGISKDEGESEGIWMKVNQEVSGWKR